MNQVLAFLDQYLYIGLTGLVILQMIIMLVGIHMIRKLSQYVHSIRDKVQEYLDVVLNDEEQNEKELLQEHLVSGQERQMVQAIQQKKKQQEEVFNSVLKEIFP